jgi:DNA-binding MarR family transcriptional regulator
MPEPKSVADLLTFRLLRLSNTLGLYSNRRYRKEFDIRLPEWRVLSIIATHGTTTARDISRVLATDKGWVGLSVESLRKRGYVKGTSDKLDMRRTLLTLTGQGQQLYDTILAIARRRQKRLLGALPDGTTETLITCLERLQAEADRMLDELDASHGSASSSK